MTTQDLIADLRSRINPAYADQRGTESYERRLCADALEAQAKEIDRLTVLAKGQHVELYGARLEIEALRKDAERLDWLRDNLFTHKWNGVVGPGCSVQWQITPDYRFRQRELSETSGVMVGDFRRAIDAARSAI